jgi:hypothetical protein
MIENRLEILEVNVTEFVQPEVVNSGSGCGEVVLLEASLEKTYDTTNQLFCLSAKCFMI